ncbi:histidine phosphatase family protein [Streptomyces sp. NPDC059517]|uniref:histidine phosphatase family protein n=1 Tax=Streptomyces sp. NPDC059517 TaxID=3346855 RepID=UPI00368A0C87
MTHRITFVSPAMSSALRQARFDDGGSLDAGGEAQARAAAGSLPSAARVVASPSVRCRETAAALGLDAVETAELAGLDAGRWRGRTLAEVAAAEPEAVARWLADPASAPHDGESVTDFCARVARWLESSAETDTDTGTATDGRTLAVVEPDVVRAAVAHVLGAPAAAFWRIDVPPLTSTAVSGRGGRWNLRLGQPLDAAGAGADR